MSRYQANVGRLDVLATALADYRLARRRILGVLNLASSNRDPLAEWSENLVEALTGGKLAENRVQKDYDLTTPIGELIQVRYLANTDEKWVNEHLVTSLPGVHGYALVIFEAFTVVGVLLFPPELARICSALKKKHPNQERTLQFTRRNWLAIRDDAEHYRRLGMEVWLPPLPGWSTVKPKAPPSSPTTSRG
jgi:hypothetical protein